MFSKRQESMIRRTTKQEQSSFIQVIDQFKDENGAYDFTKVSEIIVQMNEIYDDVRPMIQRFMKK